MTRERISLEGAIAEISCFAPGGEVSEYHIMLHVADGLKPFGTQLDTLLNAYQHIIEGPLCGAQAVFKRYFLSDAANQADEVAAADSADCAKSLVQQPPLDGTKVALWAYLMTGVSTTTRASGLCQVSHGQFRHLWNGSASNKAANSEYQMRLLFNEYVFQLAQEECTLKDNCIRTWLFVNDIDLNYQGVVRARNQAFFTQGLTTDTHFIASTGIGGRGAAPEVLVQMDNYAVGGLEAGQVTHLYASHRLNRTSDYGVSFERGTRIDYADRRHVFISGTASINNKGEVVHQRDVVSQTRHMLDNVEALLTEAGCTFDDAAHLIVYLRDLSDYPVVSAIMAERFPQHPCVIVQAPVCRPAWLVEMECMALRPAAQPHLPSF